MVFERLCASTTGSAESASDSDGCGRRFKGGSSDPWRDNFAAGIFVAAAREDVG